MTTTHISSTDYINAYNTELEADLTAALAHNAVSRRRRHETRRWLRLRSTSPATR